MLHQTVTLQVKRCGASLFYSQAFADGGKHFCLEVLPLIAVEFFRRAKPTVNLYPRRRGGALIGTVYTSGHFVTQSIVTWT